MKKDYKNHPFMQGDLVIAWDDDFNMGPFIGVLEDIDGGESFPFLVGNVWFDHAVKFENFEQYEKIRRGEI